MRVLPTVPIIDRDFIIFFTSTIQLFERARHEFLLLNSYAFHWTTLDVTL